PQERRAAEAQRNEAERLNELSVRSRDEPDDRNRERDHAGQREEGQERPDEHGALARFFPLEKAETVTERVAAERRGSMLRVLENLVSLGAKRLGSLERSVQVVYVEVEMHRGPMALELAPVIGLR